MRNGDIEVGARRWFLLCVIRDEFPDVLASLRKAPFAAFGELSPSDQRDFEDVLQLPSSAPRPESMANALRALDDWGDAWSLRAPWVLSMAARTMYQWADPTLDDPATGWRTMPGVAWYDPGPQGPCVVAPWNPVLETAAAFRERVDETVRGHLDDVKAHYAAAGWKSTPTPAVGTHARWLAMYQVGGESFSGIARASPDHSSVNGRQQVRRSVKDYAKIVGLQLRPRSTGGRPRRS